MMLKPGDFAPNFVLPDRQGGPQSIFSQELAGQTIFAFLVNSASDFCEHFLSWIESQNQMFLSKKVKPLVIASSQTKNFESKSCCYLSHSYSCSIFYAHSI